MACFSHSARRHTCMGTDLAPPDISEHSTRVGVREQTMAVKAFSTSSLINPLVSPPFASRIFAVTSSSCKNSQHNILIRMKSPSPPPRPTFFTLHVATIWRGDLKHLDQISDRTFSWFDIKIIQHFFSLFSPRLVI